MCLSFKILPPFLIAPVIGGLATADLSGTGNVDLVVTSPKANEIVVFSATPSGTFGQRRAFPAGPSPVSVTLATLNISGRIDAVIAGGPSNSISVLHGDGNGNFGKPFTYRGNLSNPRAIAVADLKNNLKPDLLVANTGGSSVAEFVNTGPAYVEEPLIPVGKSPVAIATADLLNNFLIDFVTANAGSNSVSIALNNGSGQFQNIKSVLVGKNPTAMTVAPLSYLYGNRFPSIITANSADNTISVIPNDGSGNFRERWDWPVGLNPVALAVGDLVANQTQTVVVANQGSSSLTLFACDPFGGFIATRTLHVDGVPIGVSIADTNRDGLPDIIVTLSSGKAEVLLNAPGSSLRSTLEGIRAARSPAGGRLTNGRLVQLTGVPPP